jgi:hypothetical protein
MLKYHQVLNRPIARKKAQELGINKGFCVRRLILWHLGWEKTLIQNLTYVRRFTLRCFYSLIIRLIPFFTNTFYNNDNYLIKKMYKSHTTLENPKIITFVGWHQNCGRCLHVVVNSRLDKFRYIMKYINTKNGKRLL